MVFGSPLTLLMPYYVFVVRRQVVIACTFQCVGSVYLFYFQNFITILL